MTANSIRNLIADVIIAETHKKYPDQLADAILTHPDIRAIIDLAASSALSDESHWLKLSHDTRLLLANWPTP